MRWRKMCQRVARLKKFKAKGPGDKARLMATNALPAVTYGGDINAFSPCQATRLRQPAAAASGVSIRGVDVGLAWGLSRARDPLEVAGMTLRRYAAE
eukprot:8392728-Pyramimonas_sp.AAC.1